MIQCRIDISPAGLLHAYSQNLGFRGEVECGVITYAEEFLFVKWDGLPEAPAKSAGEVPWYGEGNGVVVRPWKFAYAWGCRLKNG